MKEKGFSSLAVRLGLSVIISLAIGVAVLLALCAFAMSTEDPAAWTMPLSLTSLGLTAVACGIISSRICADEIMGSIPSAAVSGAVLSVLLWLLSVIPTDGVSGLSATVRLSAHVLIIVISLTFGFLFRPRENKRKAYNRRIRRR